MSMQGILWVTIILFAITAVGGVILAAIRMSTGRNPPASLAMLHGLLAGAGLTLLLFAAFTSGIPTYAWWALVLLIVAALGGVFMNLGYQEKRKPLPKPMMYVHALLAVVGFILLIIAAIG